LFKSWLKRPLWARVLMAMAAGVIVGLALGPEAAVLKPVGDLFIRAIKMLVVPLIFVSLLSGIVSMPNPAGLGRIGLKTMGLYVATAPIAVMIGLAFAAAFLPGTDAPVEGLRDAAAPPAKEVSLVALVLGVVPENPIAALAQGDILPIIFISLLIGIALIKLGDEARLVRDVLMTFNAVVMRITNWVLATAPIGVFALMAWVVGQQGLEILLPLLKLIACLYAACVVHVLLVSSVLIGLWARLNVMKFFRGILDALLVAYSTATSNGTLPVTLRCAEQNLGVPRSMATFVISLGATVNMDGTAIYMGVFALFTAQAFGVDLGFAQYAAIVFTGTLAAIGAAGIPSASLVLIPMVLGSAGLPVEAIALVVGIDRVMDMMRTTTNVVGDAIVAVVVARSEGVLDLETFNGSPSSSAKDA